MNTRTVKIRRPLAALKEFEQAVEVNLDSPLKVGYNALLDPDNEWQLILVHKDGKQEEISLDSVTVQLNNLEKEKKEEQIKLIKKIAQVEVNLDNPLLVDYYVLHDPENGWQLILFHKDGKQEEISLHSINDQLNNLEKEKKEEQIKLIKKIAQNDKFRRLKPDLDLFVKTLKDELMKFLKLTFSTYFLDKKLDYEEEIKKSGTCSLIFQGPRISKGIDTLKEFITNTLDAGANELIIEATLDLDDLQISFDIHDNGPGFPHTFLSHKSVLAGNTFFSGERNLYQSDKKELTSLGGLGRGLNSIINNEQGAEVSLDNVFPTGPRKCARIIIKASRPKAEEKFDDDVALDMPPLSPKRSSP